MTTKRLLTEAEILKMSDKDYMNEDQLAFFKNKLEQLQAEILRNAGQTTENLRETVIVPDPADRATIARAHRIGRIWLVRRNRRTDRHSAYAGPAHGYPVA
jgi:DnaK suppressor protein